MTDYQLDLLAQERGFHNFRQWVEYEQTRRRIEENEYRVQATRLMWGDAEARKLQKELEQE